VVNPGTTSGNIEEVVRILRLVSSITGALRKACESGDLEKTAELLNERQVLLDRAAEIRKGLRLAPVPAPVEAQVQARLTPLLLAIRQEDELFMKALREHRKQALGDLQMLQAQKSILAYIR